MSTVNGVVEAVRKDSKGLMVNGDWYSSFNAFSGINKGDIVSFDFIVKGAFKNIKGSVRKEGGSSAAPSGGNVTSGGYSRGSFPIGVKDGQRSIIRQNAVTNARELLTASMAPASLHTSSEEELLERVIGMARSIEAYTTGDLDIEIANAYMNAGGGDAGLDEA